MMVSIHFQPISKIQLFAVQNFECLRAVWNILSVSFHIQIKNNPCRKHITQGFTACYTYRELPKKIELSFSNRKCI